MAQEYPFSTFPSPYQDEPKSAPPQESPQELEHGTPMESFQERVTEGYTEDEAKRSACIIVSIIFVVLILVGFGVWYYVARDSGALPKEESKKEDTQKDQNLIVAKAGGKIVSNGFEVIIPVGALERDTRIEVEKVSEGQVTDLYHVKPDGLKFLKPVTLAIPYKESGLREGETPYDINLRYWSKFEEGFDRLLRYSVNRQDRKLRTQVMEF